MGKLHCCGPAKVRTDDQDWGELDCYLFAESILCFGKEERSFTSRVNGKITLEPRRCELRAQINIKYLQYITMNWTVITFSTGLSGPENGLENRMLHIDFYILSQALLWLQSVKDICSSLGTNPATTKDLDCADDILRIDDFGETEIRSSVSTYTDTASFTPSSASDYRQAFPINRQAPPSRKSKKHEWRRLADCLSRESDGSIKLLV